jgi:hypothetical protein
MLFRRNSVIKGLKDPFDNSVDVVYNNKIEVCKKRLTRISGKK